MTAGRRVSRWPRSAPTCSRSRPGGTPSRSFRDELGKKHAAGVNTESRIAGGSGARRGDRGGAASDAAVRGLVERLQRATEDERRELLLSPRDRGDDGRPPTAPVRASAPSRRCASRPSAPARGSPAGTSCFRARRATTRTRHGTFDDVIAPAAAHPRHGLRRALFPADPPDRHAPTARAATTRCTPEPDDPGSPYAIGAAEGGHDAIHPAARHAGGFPRACVAAAHEHGLEIALDFAIQCSPDHPWLQRASRTGSTGGPTARIDTPRTRRRNTRTSSTSISTRQDAVPDSVARAARRRAVLGRARACSIFRVDNPHTKPLPFWQWMIADMRARHPGRDLPRPRRSRGRR